MNPIETAPKGVPILVYATWAWEKIDKSNTDYEWRVAITDDYSTTYEYDEDGDKYEHRYFCAITSNPYSDYSANEKGWLPLPE